jgi:negative regulator of flagellin synthesis FlgM
MESTMKIGQPADKPGVTPLKGNASAPAADAAKGAASPAAPAAHSADASAKVQLSSTASTLLGSSDSADFDADKVARIAQSISDGTFKINADVIADKLISNAQEALGKVQR